MKTKIICIVAALSFPAAAAYAQSGNLVDGSGNLTGTGTDTAGIIISGSGSNPGVSFSLGAGINAAFSNGSIGSIFNPVPYAPNPGPDGILNTSDDGAHAGADGIFGTADDGK